MGNIFGGTLTLAGVAATIVYMEYCSMKENSPKIRLNITEHDVQNTDKIKELIIDCAELSENKVLKVSNLEKKFVLQINNVGKFPVLSFQVTDISCWNGVKEDGKIQNGYQINKLNDIHINKPLYLPFKVKISVPVINSINELSSIRNIIEKYGYQDYWQYKAMIIYKCANEIDEFMDDYEVIIGIDFKKYFNKEKEEPEITILSKYESHYLEKKMRNK